MEAAKNGDTTAVRAVLEKLNPDRKAVAFDAAHETCRGNHDECLTLLLPYVETTQMGFGMLLSECVHADHVACTEVLLQHWKSVCNNVAFVRHRSNRTRDSKHSAGDCPAMWADPAVCRVLIDAGADLHTKDKIGWSPLHYACDSGALDVVKMLVEAGADVRATNDEGCTCLMLASQRVHTESVRYLVSLPGVDVNHRNARNNYTVLHFATQHRATANEHTDMVQVLIDAGADIDAKDNDGWSPLHYACKFELLDIVKMLTRAGAGMRATTDDGETCLMLAARYGDTETVCYLMSLPEVELNQQDTNSFTALQHAVEEYDTDVVQLLIDAGADIETTDHKGGTPLHYACALGELEVVEMLVEAGAGVRATNDDGRTCLMLAACYGQTETVRYLVGLPEVDVNHRDTAKNYTALQHAVEGKETDVVQLLVSVLYSQLETANSRIAALEEVRFR